MVDENNYWKEPARRKVIRAMGGTASVGIIGILPVSANSSCGIPDDENSYNEEDYEWRIRKSEAIEEEGYYGNYDYANEIRGALYFYGSQYSPANRWEHYFLSGGMSATQRKSVLASSDDYEEYPNLAGHSLEIENQDSGSASLFSTNNSHDVGAYPPDSHDYEGHEYGDAAFTVLMGVLTIASRSTLLGVGVTAAQAAYALMDTGRSSSGGDSEFYGWQYDSGDSPCEAVHFSNFMMYSHDGESSAHVHTTNLTAQRTGGGNTNVTFWTEVDGDPDDGGSCNPGEPCPSSMESKGDSPKPGTPEYRSYLDQADFVKKVPVQNALGKWRFENSNEPVYVARNPRVKGGVINQ